MGPDNKMNWPTDQQSQYNLNLNMEQAEVQAYTKMDLAWSDVELHGCDPLHRLFLEKCSLQSEPKYELPSGSWLHIEYTWPRS
jgi:hypothetical protein